MSALKSHLIKVLQLWHYIAVAWVLTDISNSVFYQICVFFHRTYEDYAHGYYLCFVKPHIWWFQMPSIYAVMLNKHQKSFENPVWITLKMWWKCWFSALNQMSLHCWLMWLLFRAWSKICWCFCMVHLHDWYKMWTYLSAEWTVWEMLIAAGSPETFVSIGEYLGLVRSNPSVT